MSLKKNIIRIFSANFLIAISGIIIGFVVPVALSLDSYAYVKTYTLYMSYIGFLHLGFIDGMYIKYGGKNIDEIDKNIFKCEHNIFIVIQGLMTIIFLVIAILDRNIIIFLMAISILPLNTVAFHKMFYQATGEFKKFTKVSYIYTGIYLSTNLILVFLMKSNNYILYSITMLIANIVVFINLEYKFYKEYKEIKAEYYSDIWNNIRIGFYILIANLSVLLFYGIDRWFVKIYYTINDFAYYSFAISMLSIVNIFISAISIIFYNYLSKGEDEKKIKSLKNYFIIIGAGASFAYFGLSVIVNIFLKKYTPSLSIIAVSFATYPYMIVINALYINLYKSRKEEKKYLMVVMLMLCVAIVYNFIGVYVFDDVIFIAIATLLAFITWYLYSTRDFKYLKMDIKEGIYLIVILVMFIITSHMENYILGAFVYLGIYFAMTILIYKDSIKEMISIALKK